VLIDGITIVVYDCVDDNEIADDMGRWGDGIDVGIVSIVFCCFCMQQQKQIHEQTE
jgi:hypothetical protein